MDCHSAHSEQFTVFCCTAICASSKVGYTGILGCAMTWHLGRFAWVWHRPVKGTVHHIDARGLCSDGLLQGYSTRVLGTGL